MNKFRIKLIDDYYVILCVITVNLFTLGTGLAYSWSSPVIPKLQGTSGDDQNPLGTPITTDQLAWLVSLVPLGAIFGCLLVGVLASKYGKKKALLLSALPMLVSYLMTTIGSDIVTYFIAKFLSGVSCGCCYTLVPLYVGEVSDKETRGKSGCCFGITIKLGVASAYSIGAYTTVQIFSLICSLPVVVFLIFFWTCFPETPYHLVSEANFVEAERVLKKLRRTRQNVEIQRELTDITEYIKEEHSHGRIKFRTLFQDKAFRRSFIISTILLSFQQLSGIIVIISYTQTIFEEAGTKIPPHIASIIVGFIQVLSTVVTSQFVDRYGRRILLTLSTLLMSVSLGVLGAYFFIKNTGYDVQVVYWLPLTSLCFYYFAYCLGIGPVVWAMMGELFDAKGKSASASVANCVSKILTFIITFVFPYLREAVGMEGCFWMLSFFMLLGFIFVILFVPETKRKSFSEIKTTIETKIIHFR